MVHGTYIEYVIDEGASKPKAQKGPKSILASPLAISKPVFY